jgi:hypothetical protein
MIRAHTLRTEVGYASAVLVQDVGLIEGLAVDDDVTLSDLDRVARKPDQSLDVVDLGLARLLDSVSIIEPLGILDC